MTKTEILSIMEGAMRQQLKAQNIPKQRADMVIAAALDPNIAASIYQAGWDQGSQDTITEVLERLKANPTREGLALGRHLAGWMVEARKVVGDA
jgi:hypothetical protein